MIQENILVLNCGSSSLKFAVLNPINGDELISGLAERLNDPEASIHWKISGKKHSLNLPDANHQTSSDRIFELLADLGFEDQIAAIGHRVVHGGEFFNQSTLIDHTVIEAIKRCQSLAPLHNPPNLVGIEVAMQRYPSLPQIAVFDTSFHQDMPEHAYLYAIPFELYQQHSVRRYGFHGTSYRFVSQQAIERLQLEPAKNSILCAHLGNGSSATAILNGKSVDTTMGLTPLEGLVMGTRSGNVDPDLYGFLAKQCGYSLQQTSQMLNKESGLLGISGLSNDMRTLEKAASEGNKRASMAIDIFVFTLAKQLAGLATSLGHLDALVFTGGIGENSARIRAAVVERLSILGLQLNPQSNSNNGADNNGIISQENGPKILVINTNEELMIAMDTYSLTANNTPN